MKKLSKDEMKMVMGGDGLEDQFGDAGGSKKCTTDADCKDLCCGVCFCLTRINKCGCSTN